jgi:hypothetical protein
MINNLRDGEKELKKKCQQLATEYERSLADVRPEGKAWFRCYFQ